MSVLNQGRIAAMTGGRTGAALLMTAFVLAGCVPAPVAPPPAPQAPVVSAVPDRPIRDRIASPYRAPAPTPASTAPVESAVPQPAGPSGPLDARTGLHQSALVSVSGNADSQFIVLFRPSRTASSNIEAAPGKLCGGAGVASSRTNSPGASSAMPGVQTMIVKCGAA